MKFPNKEDEIMMRATMEWMADQFDGDMESARKYVKMNLACMDMWNRGFTWTDI